MRSNAQRETIAYECVRGACVAGAWSPLEGKQTKCISEHSRISGRALDELFPGQEAYTDDNQVVFGTDPEGRTRATIEIRKPQHWMITHLQ